MQKATTRVASVRLPSHSFFAAQLSPVSICPPSSPLQANANPTVPPQPHPALFSFHPLATNTMGAEQSAPHPTTPSPSPDTRSTLERWLDPYSVLSAASADPILLEPRLTPVSPSSSAAAPSVSSAHFSLDVGELKEVDLTPSPCGEHLQPQEGDTTQEEAVDPVDAAMARIVPAPLVALLRSPAVSGEMAFAAAAAQRQRRARPGASGERRVLV